MNLNKLNKELLKEISDFKYSFSPYKNFKG